MPEYSCKYNAHEMCASEYNDEVKISITRAVQASTGPKDLSIHTNN